MGNYFSRAEFDMLEGLIETTLKESAVVSIKYHKAQYYIYSVNPDSLLLVDPKAAYFPITSDGRTTLSPDFVTVVLPEKSEDIFKQLIYPKKLTAFYAEQLDGSARIVLNRKEAQNPDFTCRFYYYNKEYFEIEDGDALINETVAESLINSLKTMRDEMVAVLSNSKNMAEERKAAMQMWWKESGNRLYDATVIQHPEGDISILSRMEMIIRGIADVVTEE